MGTGLRETHVNLSQLTYNVRYRLRETEDSFKLFTGSEDANEVKV